jgi:hypothetical protein
MGNISEEKLEKIKTSTEKKKKLDKTEVHSHHKKNPAIKPENNSDYNTIFKNLYKSQYLNKSEKNFINNNSININNINNSKYTINTVKTNVNAEINKKIEDDLDEVNYIIFRKHKSFESENNNTIKNYFKCETNTTMISLSTNGNTNTIKLNSEPDKNSNNSDYIDISQSISLFTNKSTICKTKIIYNDGTILRNSYYYKLITSNIWKPFIKDKICNTIFFFDWDDTLLCTSFLIPILNSQNNSEKIKIIKNNLKNLDEIVSKLLLTTLDKGLVFLVTTAAPGWVEFSSTTFLPMTAKVLREIKIFSAKGLYSKNYPGDPRQWKIKAFKYIIELYNINTKLVSNLICFGDSLIDLEAIENLKYMFSNAFVKIIKFKECPHPIELEKEVWIAASQLDYIIKKVKNLTLKVSKKKAD